MSYNVFITISLLYGSVGTNFASNMMDISFFFPKQKQGGAPNLNRGLGSMGVSVVQLVAPLVVSPSILAVFGSQDVKQPDGTELYLANASQIWVLLFTVFTIAAWFGMNDLATSKASVKGQLPVLRRGYLQVMSLLYLAAFGSFIGLSTGFAMLLKTQLSDVQILQYAFSGSLIGVLVHSTGGALPNRLDGIRVTLVSFILMVIFGDLLLLTLSTDEQDGSFMAFFVILLALFLTAELGSGSTSRMVSAILRKLTAGRVKTEGGSNERTIRETTTDTIAALGFISTIGAIGGFFIPRAFGSSLTLTGSPVGAMKVFLVFCIACVVVTWTVYGRHSKR